MPKNFLFWSFVSVLVFVMITLGGYVHNSGASLACPDWPLCYGQAFPKMEGLILIEHSHRLLGTLIGFFILIKFFYERTKYHLFLLIFVILQGVFGGITVLLKLSTLFSTLHLLCSILFFFSVFSQIPFDIKKTIAPKKIFQYLFFLVFFQIIYGALVRHLGLGLACGGGFNRYLFFCEYFEEPLKSSLHVIHRLFGFFLFFLFLFTSLKNRKLPLFFHIPFFLVIFQVALGIMTVGTFINPIWTTLHLTFALLILISLFLCYKKSL